MVVGSIAKLKMLAFVEEDFHLEWTKKRRAAHPVPVGNLVQGERIGVVFNGIPPVPNAGNGLLISGGIDNTVGGTAAGAGNMCLLQRPGTTLP
jgi:hypothetical protein